MADKQGEYSSARYRRGDRRNGASVVLNIYDLVRPVGDTTKAYIYTI